MQELGAKSILALVVPEPQVAYQILALNIEKPHNLRKRTRMLLDFDDAVTNAVAALTKRVRGMKVDKIAEKDISRTGGPAEGESG